MWGTALGGILLLVVGLDVLTRRRLSDALRAVVFRPEDTQIFEPRDMVWAGALVVVGGILTVWGLKELFAPRSVVLAAEGGLELAIAGPFRRSVRLSWDQVDDVFVAAFTDDDEVVPALGVRVFDPGLLPVDPWGARWVDDHTVAVLAGGWDRSPGDAVSAIGDLAVEAVGRRADGAVAGEDGGGGRHQRRPLP